MGKLFLHLSFLGNFCLRERCRFVFLAMSFLTLAESSCEGSEPSPSTTFVESVFSTAFFKASSFFLAASSFSLFCYSF